MLADYETVAVDAGTTQVPEPLLSIEGMNAHFAQSGTAVHVLRDVGLSIAAGESLALVGESGSGKSTLGLAAMGLLRPPGYVTSGEIRWEGQSLLSDSMVNGIPVRTFDRRAINGKGGISIVWQDPAATFNPRLSVGRQLMEGMRRQLGMSKPAAQERAVELLDLVGIREPRQRLRDHPYQLSGGMLQRVGIAMAVATEPKLLIADEPTTALDVTVQAQILDLIASLQRELGLALLLITHDLGVVAKQCSRIAVMYSGRVLEQGPVASVFAEPRHPYTAGLLGCMPTLRGDSDELHAIPGEAPDLSLATRGCPFAPRCDRAVAACHDTLPQPRWTHDAQGNERWAACLRIEGNER